jgi:hypothetical protein
MSNIADEQQNRRTNLQVLATYLAYADKPEEVKFDMMSYSDPKHSYDSTTCGTTGCAVGFGPFAGILKEHYETWFSYVKRTLVPQVGSVEFDWCFSAYWNQVDNTPEGAAKRIQLMLDTGVPNTFRYSLLTDFFETEQYEDLDMEADVYALPELYKNVEVKR